uniref:Uncharacterized protein n=1 Tax=Rhipicephalus zambeziensis TaxID=60191 RepID=A0A224Z1W0_9ACAR
MLTEIQKKIATAPKDFEIENTYTNGLREPTIESRTSEHKRKGKRNKKSDKDAIKPIDAQVTYSGNSVVTIATFGTNTTTYQMNYTGDWSQHKKCLMPCNPKYPDPCKSLPDDNCTCLIRKNFRSTGTCASLSAVPGNKDYKRPKKGVIERK